MYLRPPVKHQVKGHGQGEQLHPLSYEVQLDWLQVTSWDHVINFAVEVRFKFQDQIRKSQLKLHGAMFLKNLKIEIGATKRALVAQKGGQISFFFKKKLSDAEFIGAITFAIRHDI